MSAGSIVTNRVSNPAPVSTSNGPNASRSSNPSKMRISVVMPASSSRRAAPASGRNANIHYDPANVHHVAVLALDAVVPLDLAIPAQVFGNYEETPYRVTVCAAEPGPVADHRGVPDRRPGRPRGARRSPTPSSSRASRPTCASRPGPSSRPSARHRRAARAWPRSAPGRSHSPPPASSTAAAPPPTGATPPISRRSTRACASSRTCSTSTRGRCSPPRASPPASTCACTSSAPTTAPRSRATSPAASSSHPTARAARPNTSTSRSRPTPGGSLASTRAWALEHLNEPLTVRTLAAHAHVSERTFARRFTAETGVPVLQWLLARRVDAARAALESTDATIDEIADTCGFGTAANLRKHFRRHVSTTPTAYRRTFAT